jgi:hypothetical protein
MSVVAVSILSFYRLDERAMAEIRATRAVAGAAAPGG